MIRGTLKKNNVVPYDKDSYSRIHRYLDERKTTQQAVLRKDQTSEDADPRPDHYKSNSSREITAGPGYFRERLYSSSEDDEQISLDLQLQPDGPVMTFQTVREYYTEIREYDFRSPDIVDVRIYLEGDEDESDSGRSSIVYKHKPDIPFREGAREAQKRALQTVERARAQDNDPALDLDLRPGHILAREGTFQFTPTEVGFRAKEGHDSLVVTDSPAGLNFDTSVLEFSKYDSFLTESVHSTPTESKITLSQNDPTQDFFFSYFPGYATRAEDT